MASAQCLTATRTVTLKPRLDHEVTEADALSMGSRSAANSPLNMDKEARTRHASHQTVTFAWRSLAKITVGREGRPVRRTLSRASGLDRRSCLATPSCPRRP